MRVGKTHSKLLIKWMKKFGANLKTPDEGREGAPPPQRRRLGKGLLHHGAGGRVVLKVAFRAMLGNVGDGTATGAFDALRGICISAQTCSTRTVEQILRPQDRAALGSAHPRVVWSVGYGQHLVSGNVGTRSRHDVWPLKAIFVRNGIRCCIRIVENTCEYLKIVFGEQLWLNIAAVGNIALAIAFSLSSRVFCVSMQSNVEQAPSRCHYSRSFQRLHAHSCA